MSDTSKNGFFDGEKWSNLVEKFSNIGATIKDFLDSIYKIFKGEVDNTVQESQSQIDKIATKLINDKLITTDESISTSELEALEDLIELEGNDKNFEKWFDWLEKSGNTKLTVDEERRVLKQLAIESNDELKEDEIDLRQEEIDEVAKFVGKKLELCDAVLKCNDEDFEKLGDKFKKPEEIVKSCNNVLTEKNNGNTDLNTIDLNTIDSVTEELIIQNLKNRAAEEASQNLVA